MWDILGNRAAVVLISVTCGCVLVYNAWGAILALVLSFLLIIYACYSLLANDSLVSPHAYHVLVYLWEAILELRTALNIIIGHSISNVYKVWHNTSRSYRDHFPFRMVKRRGSKCYQLSNDSYGSAVTGAAVRPKDSSPSSSTLSSRFNQIDQLSPIPHDIYRSRDDISITTFHHAGDHDRLQQVTFGKYTSTPVFRASKESIKNGDVALPSHGISSKKTSPVYTQNHTLSRGENVTQFSPEGSPWGTSISPKMRPRPAGIKTVQTIAGPLLASTRYNIDPKVYADVTSPGLTTRLTKYATEAKSKLTHQTQYCTGQFPKVNLYTNPIPLLSTKSTKIRMPVTVRLAPPEVARYSPPERQRLLSKIRHTANNKPATNVVQVLREISLKRHASREDISFDVTKKQRTDGFFNEDREMILEETKQKRSREDSSKSEEDLSPQNKSVRPAKRTKTRSCYDILNSLSSSVHVSSGVKRKANDFSRSGTPDFEKHFKSLESAQPDNSLALPQSQNIDTSYDNKSEFKEIYSKSPETLNCDKVQESPLVKGILKTCNKESRTDVNKIIINSNKYIETDNTESIASAKSTKLVDKLFMRAEPEQNEQLKLLVEEPGNIKAKFTINNVEEIKKEDIRNMRKTSMKARLQSMFDAISGKADGRINPDVVIQADDVNAIIPVTCSVSCASLNSSTTTISVNTTPISTAAIVPDGLRSISKSDAKPVTIFDVSNTALSAQSNVLITSTPEIKRANLTTKIDGSMNEAKVTSTTVTVTSTESLQKATSSTSNTTSTFTLAKLATETPPTPSSSLSSSVINISSNAITAAAPATSISTNFLQTEKIPLSSSSISVSLTSASSVKVDTNNVFTTTSVSSSNSVNTPASTTFTFDSSKFSALPAGSAQTSTLSQSTGTSSSINTNTTSTGFNSAVSSKSNNITTTTSAPIQTQSLPIFGSTTLQPSKSSSLFAFGQSNNNTQSANISINQATSLPQDTNKSYNFTTNTSTTTNSSFNVNTTTMTSVFGLSAPAFSLGTTSTTSFPSSSKALFVFGGNNENTMVTPNTTANTTAVFGAMNNNAIPMYGVSTTSVPQFGSSSITSPQFGISTTTTQQFRPSTTTIPQFGTSTTTNSQLETPTTTSSQFGVANTATPQFGTSTTTIPQFGAPTTTVPQFSASTTSIFAATPNTSTTNIFGTTNSQPPVFGAGTSTSGTTSIFDTPKTTASSMFAATTNVSSSDSTIGSNLFASVNATTASSVFGNGAPNFFGQMKPSFGTGTGIFGNTSTSLFGSTTQTTNAPTFGIANAPTSSTITSTFDNANNTTPAFGTPNVGTTTANAQTASAPAFGGTTVMFGSTDNTSIPLYGANTAPTAGAFSSATNTFGGQKPASLTFGATGNNSATTFTDNKSPFGATPSSTTGFGSTSIPAFGASSTSNNTNMFFGNAQKNGQQNATFSFASNFNAGNNNNCTTTSSAPFQFGPTVSKPVSTGFNFTAPSATPTINFGSSATPTFNPSTPGMFSIGSGSTAPRSRTIRTRKPR